MHYTSAPAGIDDPTLDMDKLAKKFSSVHLVDQPSRPPAIHTRLVLPEREKEDTQTESVSPFVRPGTPFPFPDEDPREFEIVPRPSRSSRRNVTNPYPRERECGRARTDRHISAKPRASGSTTPSPLPPVSDLRGTKIRGIRLNHMPAPAPVRAWSLEDFLEDFEADCSFSQVPWRRAQRVAEALARDSTTCPVCSRPLKNKNSVVRHMRRRHADFNFQRARNVPMGVDVW
jgi:hypothetical protein